MPTGQAIVCEIKNHFPIPEADRIVSTSVNGENIIVGKNTAPVGTRGLLIDSECQLSEAICHNLNLYRHEVYNKDITKKGFIEDNRRVRAIRLKKTPSTGIFLSFDELESVPGLKGISKLDIGVQLNDFNKVDICNKYVIIRKTSGNRNQPKIKRNVCPSFHEHVSTDQLMRNIHTIKDKDIVTVTQKMHGTSCRCANLKVESDSIFRKFLKWAFKIDDKDYRFVVGSRHVLKYVDGMKLSKKVASYYEEDIWTKSAKDNFHNRLYKGECIFYEILGYLPKTWIEKNKDGDEILCGTPIMPSQSNEKLKKFLDKDSYKEFMDKYGSTTNFSYGCQPGEYKIFVYRITMTNEDGLAIDLTWPQVKRRCEELGVEHVAEIDRYMQFRPDVVDDRDLNEALEDNFSHLTEEPDRNFPNQIHEGIVVRIDRENNRPTFLKSKTTNFKILEGIIRDDSNYIDIEDNN